MMMKNKVEWTNTNGYKGIHRNSLLDFQINNNKQVQPIEIRMVEWSKKKLEKKHTGKKKKKRKKKILHLDKFTIKFWLVFFWACIGKHSTNRKKTRKKVNNMNQWKRKERIEINKLNFKVFGSKKKKLYHYFESFFILFFSNFSIFFESSSRATNPNRINRRCFIDR